MKIFKLALLTLTSAFALTAFSPQASAVSISDFTSTVGTSSTQLGRLSRNGVQQDWTGKETYPGVINPTTTYYYHTYTFASSLFTGAPYVDISVFDELNAGTFFVSAYANSYNPNNLATNWLGDPGSSGNAFGTDARYFDVVLPVGASLVLVVNSTGAGTAGTASPFDISINAYADTMYNDPVANVAPVPEPSTLITLGTGLAGLVTVVRRNVSASQSAQAQPAWGGGPGLE